MNTIFSRMFRRSRIPSITIEGIGPVELSHGDWVAMPFGDRDFMVMFEADGESPPSFEQVALFEHFMSKKDAVLTQCKRRLVNDGRVSSVTGLELYSVAIPKSAEAQRRKFVIELSYADANNIFVVSIKDEQPVATTVED